MKPLNKLEQEMFKAMTGFEFDIKKDGHVLQEQIDDARAAAQVAIDLARRANNWGHRERKNFESFLASEGITEPEKQDLDNTHTLS